MNKYIMYLLLLLIMGIQIIYMTKANLASIIQLLMIAIAISITDSLYRPNKKLRNITLIIINTAILSISHRIVWKEISISLIIVYAVFSVIFCLIARSEKRKEMNQQWRKRYSIIMPRIQIGQVSFALSYLSFYLSFLLFHPHRLLPSKFNNRWIYFVKSEIEYLYLQRWGYLGFFINLQI